jgi:predicted ATPase
MLLLLAGAHGAGGDAEEGLGLILEAQRTIADTGEREYESSAHHAHGELLLMLSPPDVEQADAAFRKALDVARRQSAKSLELRAAMSLARLWQGQGRTKEACGLLTPVYEWFTEGFDTKDLKDAKALLAELA